MSAPSKIKLQIQGVRHQERPISQDHLDGRQGGAETRGGGGGGSPQREGGKKVKCDAFLTGIGKIQRVQDRALRDVRRQESAWTISENRTRRRAI